jgi:2-polyprenyl-3-methyl-5-hydroxy-6-metoxy-1,4-benzoquinol methylase
MASKKQTGRSVMEQQAQTRNYFQANADDWQTRSSGGSGRYSVIEGRHRAVLAVAAEARAGARFLDVGCGTGQLVLGMAKRGFKSEGVDFAAEMISKCEENKRAAGVPADFHCRSFFDTAYPDGSYDIISAQGFIEYLSPAEMMDFFARSHRILRAGGALVVGSRNRLFNLVSMNEFTNMERRLGTVELLLSETIAFNSSTSQEGAFVALRGLERTDPQPDHHPLTEIQVTVRYQYAPADLVCRLRSLGYAPKAIFPVHYHGISPAVKATNPGLHDRLANAMAEIGMTDQRLLPFCSTFVLDVRKNAPG